MKASSATWLSFPGLAALVTMVALATLTEPAKAQAAQVSRLTGSTPVPERFATRLTRVAADAIEVKNLLGDGRVELAMEGDVAVITGRYSGLVSNATRARVFLGAAVGVPGQPLFDLKCDPSTAGVISGRVTLNADQWQALRANRLYLQLDSAKAPAGTLWGWLMPAHAIVAEHVPEQQPWSAGGL